MKPRSADPVLPVRPSQNGGFGCHSRDSAVFDPERLRPEEISSKSAWRGRAPDRPLQSDEHGTHQIAIDGLLLHNKLSIPEIDTRWRKTAESI